MATKNTTALKTASVLSFERKLDPSDAVFSSGPWADRGNAKNWPAVAVREKSVRGTISNRLKTKDMDPAKVDAEVEKPNLQTVDVAALPHESDTLQVHFTLRVLGGAGVPSSCNSAAYQQKLKSVIDGYTGSSGFAALAHRYASNLANGRFLWRNRLSAEMIEVRISHMQNGEAVQSWTFDALEFATSNFEAPAAHAAALAELSTVIEEGLAGKQYVLIEVSAFARVGAGQEVFPSQELILDKGSKTAGQKSKVLYTVGQTSKQDGAAAMHSQKIGNAIRTVDTWYPGEDGLGPIPVEPYGSVTAQGKAYRQPKEGQDFYSLLDGWVIKDQVPALEQQHYVMANLIRGGVFGESGKD
jgi:CRISPR-associated protein Csy3